MNDNQAITRKDLEVFGNDLSKKIIDEVSDVISVFANQVGARFDKVDSRFDRIEKRLDDHDEQFRKLNEKYDHLINTLDVFLKRLDDIESDNTARDAQLARLERWIEQVAKKTGVKLEY